MKKVIIGLFSSLSLLLGLALGCVDPEEGGGGSTGGTSLYVFDTSDTATSRVLVYSDVASVFENLGTQPSRTMSGSIIETVKNLAWGGMCFDPNSNKLYLLSETGDLVRIDRARSQNGNITNTNEIFSFRIADGNRLPSGKFGQASVDSGSGALYVTESNDSDTRIWVITNAGTATSTSNMNSSQITLSGVFGDKDKHCMGVTAHSGSVYGYFDEGTNFTIIASGRSYSGPRLRKGTSSSFADRASLVIRDVADSTNKPQLAKYGCLAADRDNRIYLAKHLDDSLSTGNSVLIFRAGDFLSSSVNSDAPYRSFGNVSNLRVISHAITRDWLVGATSDDDKGSNVVWLWRSPSTGSPAANELRLGAGVSIRGLALDGSN